MRRWAAVRYAEVARCALAGRSGGLWQYRGRALIYLLIFLLLCLLRVFLQRHVDRNKAYPFVLVFLALFAGFRFNVGCDWISYVNQYESFGKLPLAVLVTYRDFLWSLIGKWLYMAGMPFPVYNVVAAAIFFACFHALAKRQPDRLTFLILAFPLLILLMVMSAMRQGVAIALICVAYTAFIDRRPWRYAVFVLLAAGFHSSALVLLILLPLVKGKLSISRMMLAVLLAIPGGILIMNSSSGDVMMERYLSGREEAAGAAFRVLLLFISGIGYMVFLRARWKQLFPADEKLATLGALGMLGTMPLLAVASVVADRLGYYLVPIQLMIFARLPFLRLQRGGQLWMIAPFAMLMLTQFVWTTYSAIFELCFDPYQTWLFGYPSPMLGVEFMK